MGKAFPQDEALWYAVATRSRQEKVAASLLESLAIAHFLPLVNEERRWSDRKQMVSLPLFPGYLFVNIARSCETKLRVLKVPGVVNFVGNQHGPVAIPTEQIDSIRTVLLNGIECSSYPLLRAGNRVRIVRGPLAGIEGIFLRSGSDSKLVISIEMIQRSLAVSLRGCDIEPVLSGRIAHGVLGQETFSPARIA
jgi:transcription elongation factor/antiterminator RfaH